MSERAKGNRRASVVWYDSPEAIHAEFVRGIEEASGESMADAEWGGETADGEPVHFTETQMLDGYREQGMWGFCDGRRVHIWHDYRRSSADLVWLIAHEIAHLWGADAPDIVAEEEAGAELVAEIAAEAHSIVTQRLPFPARRHEVWCGFPNEACACDGTP